MKRNYKKGDAVKIKREDDGDTYWHRFWRGRYMVEKRHVPSWSRHGPVCKLSGYDIDDDDEYTDLYPRYLFRAPPK